jgi:hypothetical protein
MAEPILTTNIQKEQGCLYFCTVNAEGFIVVNKAKAGRPKKIVEVIAE